MIDQLVRSNKHFDIFTIHVSYNLSRNGLAKFNPNFQEICAANFIIYCSREIKIKPLLDNFYYSDYI